MPFTGSCHCGLVAYEVAEDPPTEAMACNLGERDAAEGIDAFVQKRAPDWGKAP